MAVATTMTALRNGGLRPNAIPAYTRCRRRPRYTRTSAHMYTTVRDRSVPMRATHRGLTARCFFFLDVLLYASARTGLLPRTPGVGRVALLSFVRLANISTHTHTRTHARTHTDTRTHTHGLGQVTPEAGIPNSFSLLVERVIPVGFPSIFPPSVRARFVYPSASAAYGPDTHRMWSQNRSLHVGVLSSRIKHTHQASTQRPEITHARIRVRWICGPNLALVRRLCRDSRTRPDQSDVQSADGRPSCSQARLVLHSASQLLASFESGVSVDCARGISTSNSQTAHTPQVLCRPTYRYS